MTEIDALNSATVTSHLQWLQPIVEDDEVTGHQQLQQQLVKHLHAVSPSCGRRAAESPLLASSERQ